MRKIYILVTLALISFSSFSQTINGTEAVEYDPTQDRFLITNGSSILQQDGEDEPLSFFGDGGASFGMEVMNGKLFAISNSVEAYDLDTEEELMSVNIPGSAFLNGMASDPTTNRIWVTDFGANSIIEMDVTDTDNPVITTVVNNTLCTPNGITHDEDNNRLVFTCWSGGNINAVDLSDYSVSTLTNTGLNSIDGIDHDGQGNFYISSWQPTRISKLSNDFDDIETITAPGISQPADISYGIEIETLAIANSGNSSITYIYFGDPVNISELDASLSFSVFPNPLSENSIIEFDVIEAGNCSISIFDTQGKLVHEVLNDNLNAGTHKLSLAGFAFESGAYICEINTSYGSQSINLIKR